MAKNDENLKAAEDFVRSVLEKNFKQTVDKDRLRDAAAKLCEALPEKQPEIA